MDRSERAVPRSTDKRTKHKKDKKASEVIHEVHDEEAAEASDGDETSKSAKSKGRQGAGRDKDRSPTRSPKASPRNNKRSVDIGNRYQFENDPFDAKAGKRYRDLVLAPGGVGKILDHLTTFLGRPPSQEAFLKSRGIA